LPKFENIFSKCTNYYGITEFNYQNIASAVLLFIPMLKDLSQPKTISF